MFCSEMKCFPFIVSSDEEIGRLINDTRAARQVVAPDVVPHGPAGPHLGAGLQTEAVRFTFKVES